MAADSITVPRAAVFEAAAWLLAFTELFEEIEEETPSSFGDEWGQVAMGLAHRLARGDGFSNLDDDGFDSHPVLVELHARAREFAASTLARVAERGNEGPLAFHGDTYTAEGLRGVAARLTMLAERTRAERVIHPWVSGLVCCECSRRDRGDEWGWTLRLDVDGALAAFCPDCDRREFQ